MLFLLGDAMDSSAKVEALEAELWQGRPDIENYDAVGLRAQIRGGAKVLYYTAHCVDKSDDFMAEFRFEHAVIRWVKSGGPPYTANFNDGSVKIYDEKQKVKNTQKFYDALESIRTGTRPVCTLKTVRSHLECVVRAQEFPIKKVAPENLSQGRHEEDAFYFVPGLREAFLRSYEEKVLPSEIGFIV
jgi:hypothetical protein